MTGTVRQPNFLQPVQSFLLRLPARHPAHQQRHGNILDSGELRQKVMKLPYKPEFPASEFSCLIFREPAQVGVGEVYVTLGSSIKNCEDVQQGTLAGPRFTDNREHLSRSHLE